VEDEPLVREWVREVLLQSNYRVLEAGNGNEALKMWDDQNGKIDLLLTDMVMPEGMTGRELAEQLKSRDPLLKVIYSSGYSSEIMGSDAELRDSTFLPKPYSAPQLARLIRNCLDAEVNAPALQVA